MKTVMALTDNCADCSYCKAEERAKKIIELEDQGMDPEAARADLIAELDLIDLSLTHTFWLKMQAKRGQIVMISEGVFLAQMKTVISEMADDKKSPIQKILEPIIMEHSADLLVLFTSDGQFRPIFKVPDLHEMILEWMMPEESEIN